MCTGTPCIKSGSGQSVPVHMCRKSTVVKVYRYTTNVYRYTCMGITRLGQKFDQYARALLSTNKNGENHIGGGYKSKRAQVKGSFLTSRVQVLEGEEFSLHLLS